MLKELKHFLAQPSLALVEVASAKGSTPREAGAWMLVSRKAIFAECDASLRRLGTDYIDLYQTHRWDFGTPIEETMEALHDLVRAGKVRYIGASSMNAWQFAKAQAVADLGGWTRFATMQDHYNLLYREEEREMLPLCLDQGVGGDAVQVLRVDDDDVAGGHPAQQSVDVAVHAGGAGDARP